MSLFMLDVNVLQLIVNAMIGSTSSQAMDALEWLRQEQKEKSRIVISTIVLGEFMAALDASTHGETLATIGSAVIILPYDTKASLEFARLRALHAASNGNPIYADIRQADMTKTGQRIRVDTLVVAHAIAANCTTLVSLDEGLKKLAAGQILIQQPIPRQKPLFGSP